MSNSLGRLAGPILLLGLLLVAPGASAAVTLYGSHFTDGDLRLDFATNVSSSVGFTPEGALVLDGVTFDLNANDPTTWTLTEWSSTRIVFTGTSVGGGTLQVDGLGGNWRVTGVRNLPAFWVAGSGAEPMLIPAGAQTVTLEKDTSSALLDSIDASISSGLSLVLVLVLSAVLLGATFVMITGPYRSTPRAVPT